MEPGVRIRVGYALEAWRLMKTRTAHTDRGGCAAEELIREIGIGWSLDVLTHMLHRGDVRTRAAAALALARRGDSRASKALIGALGDDCPDVQEAAAGALARMGDAPLVAAVLAVLQGDADAAAALQDRRAVRALIQALGSRDPSRREAAVRAMVSMGRPVVPSLLRALRRRDGRVRAMSAQALGGIGVLQAGAGLSRALRHPDAPVRAAAARALGQIGEAGAAPTLAPLLGDGDARVRRAAALALGRLGPKGLAALLTLLGRRRPDVREAAQDGLAGAGSPAVQPLVNTLTHPDPETRLAAAQTLWRLGAAAGAALEPLSERIRNEKHACARAACRDALRRITAALRDAPTELEAAPPPAGRGTELEAAPHHGESSAPEVTAAPLAANQGPARGSV